MHEKKNTYRCNNILVLIGEDWSLFRLEYQVTYTRQNWVAIFVSLPSIYADKIYTQPENLTRKKHILYH